MNEIWKSIKGYEDKYEVSNLGRIRNSKGEILNQYEVNGYKKIDLWKKNSRKKFRVHRLVAEAFLPNPNNLPAVNHKDFNRTNNCLDNLEWISTRDNNIYSLGKPVFNITTGVKYNCLKDAANAYGLKKPDHITKCCNGTAQTSASCQWCWYQDGMEYWDIDQFMFIWD